MRELLALVHARSACVTLPDRLKLAWRAVRRWWHAAVLAWIDRYLQRHDQERAYMLLDFEELEVLYEEADIPVLFDEAAIDAGYRSLAAAIVLQAVRDTANPRLSQEANHFLTSPLCKSLLRLSGIHWTATSTDFPRAAIRLQGRRMRHQAGSTRSSLKTVRTKTKEIGH